MWTMAASSSGQATARRRGIYVCVCPNGPVAGAQTRRLIELDTALDAAGHEWKEDVLEIAADRFERRFAQEMSAVRIEIADSRLSLIRWVAGLLIAHAGVIIGTVFAMMTFFVNALKP
jgi:hypothetical protein